MKLLSAVGSALSAVRSMLSTACRVFTRWLNGTRAATCSVRYARLRALHSLTAASALLALATVAQQLPAQDLEEIVVTAGFRDRDLMTRPGSATVVDEETARDRAAQHLESVLNVAPNINYASGGSRARFIQVRGIGDLEQFIDPKHFPSVGVAFDDIDLGGTANAGMLFDTGQVEILRGPQGTRFGTGALAGLINIRGNRPSDEFMSYIEGGIGNYGARNLGAVVSGPLGATAGARIAVQKNQGDGYIDNAALGRSDTNGYDETTVRATLEAAPNDRSTYGLTAFHFDGRNGYDAFSLDNTRTTLADEPGRDDQQSTALAGRAEWSLGEAATLSAVATWLDSDLAYGYDEDWTFDGICDGTLCDPVWDRYVAADEYLRNRSEVSFDLRLLGEAQPGGSAERSEPGGRSNSSGRGGQGEPDRRSASISYVVGAYAQSRDEDLQRIRTDPWSVTDFTSAYETDREALYGQIDIIPGGMRSRGGAGGSEGRGGAGNTGSGDTAAASGATRDTAAASGGSRGRLSFTAGFRYERFNDAYADSGGFTSTSDDTLTSGELTLSWAASTDTTLYATIARGAKAGGVNTAASSSFALMQPAFQSFMQGRLLVGKERLDNREVGLKGRYADGRLALRAALFAMDRDNAQLESWMWDGVSFLWIGFLDNVDGSNTGAELELEFDATSRTRFFASLGWLDTEVDRIETFDLDLGDFVVRTGIEQAKSPEFQFNVGASVSFSDRWRARVEVEGRDDNRFGYYHAGSLPSYTLLNASIAADFGSTELQLWGRNLADEDYAVHGLYFGNDPRKGWINETYLQYGEPRVVGVSVRYSF